MHVYGKTSDFPNLKAWWKIKLSMLNPWLLHHAPFQIIQILTFNNCLNKIYSSVFTDHLKYQNVWLSWKWAAVWDHYWKCLLEGKIPNASTAAVYFYCQSSWGAFSKLTPWKHCAAEMSGFIRNHLFWPLSSFNIGRLSSITLQNIPSITVSLQ